MALQPAAVMVPYNHNHHHQPPPQQHYQPVDEREGFMMWLRGEFAAANAIIDAMCHHLRAAGDPAEYDAVIAAVQRRRCNWNPVLHMQQYFSVAEVVGELHQVGWRRQQQQHQRKDYRRGGGGGGGGGRGYRGGGYEVSNGGAVVEVKDEKKEFNENLEANGVATRQGRVQGVVAHVDDKEEAAGSSDVDGSEIGSEDKRSLQVSPKSFVATEICEGKSVNIAEGMKLYEDLIDDSEMSKLNTLVNDLRASGRRGQLKGQTFITYKRPMRGHGREIIQLGIPIADLRLDDEAAGRTYKDFADLNTEPIPELLEDVIERLLNEKVVSIKPDSAIIDFFNEGDHSQPQIWPYWFGRPVCVLFLTECEMSFGKVITIDHPGDYRSVLKLSLSPGSMLVTQGRSADFARHAIPSLRKQRILVTLVKSQPKKTLPNDYHHRFPSLPPPSNWAPPPPSRSPIHNARPMTPKHFGPIPPTGILPVPTQPLPPPNGVQPIFVPNPVGPTGIPFPAPVGLPPASAGWPPASPSPPRHPPVVPGTGVFLPPQGSGNSSSNQHASTLSTESNITVEIPSGFEEEEKGMKKSDDDVRVPEQECNGTTDEKKEERENQDLAE